MLLRVTELSVPRQTKASKSVSLAGMETAGTARELVCASSIPAALSQLRRCWLPVRLLAAKHAFRMSVKITDALRGGRRPNAEPYFNLVFDIEGPGRKVRITATALQKNEEDRRKHAGKEFVNGGGRR